MRGFGTDLRQAARGLARTRWVTGVVVFTLALGVGAPTAVFGVVNAVLLRPLPCPEADRLVSLKRINERGAISDEASGAAFLAWRDQARSLSDVASYTGARIDLRTGDGPRRVRGAVVSSSFFALLGSPSLLGRAQTLDRGVPQVVLGEYLWRRQFGGDRDIVGRSIVLNGESVAVAGVMPARFEFPPGAELWLGTAGRVPPHQARPLEDQSTRWNSNYLQVIGRLQPGVAPGSAQAELDAIGERLSSVNGGGNAPVLVPLRDALARSARAPLLILLGAVSLILLIACVNVSHLLLARALQRKQEIAVRMALGASRARVARLFLAESLILAAVGGGLGTLVALWLAPPLAALGPRGLRPESISADLRVIAFAVLLSLVAALMSSLIPALSGQPPAEALKEAGRGASMSGGGRVTRSVLVGLEVGLAVVLLAGAGLLARSYLHLQEVDTGFRAQGVLTADLFLPPARYARPADQVRFVDRVLAGLRARPDVELAAVVSQLPMSSTNSSRDVDLGRGDDAPSIDANLRSVAPDYLAALGIPLLAGRAIAAHDSAAAPVAVVNQLFARRAWPGESPLGKTILVQLDERPLTVIGVVGNILHSGMDSEARPEVYIPYPAEPRPTISVVVRGAVPPEQLAPALREVVAAVDPDLALVRLETMEQRIAASLQPTRFRTLLFVIAAGLALVLALVGIYGVIAYAVAHRRRELGIRLALGARPSRLVAGVVGQSLRPVAAGMVSGIAAALLLSRLLAGLLFGVSAGDPATYAAIALLAGAAAALASFVAARRATLIDPMTALRSE